eukprot:2458397-Ditylum_brightwellii.AAC.1
MASVQDLRLVGFSVRRTFASYREARKWKSEGVSVEGLRRAPTTLTPVPVSGVPRSAQKQPPERYTGIRADKASGNAGPPQQTIVYGMASPTTGERMVAASRAEVDLLSDMGYALKKLFNDPRQASAWEEKRDLDDVGVRPPNPQSKGGHTSKVGPD